MADTPSSIQVLHVDDDPELAAVATDFLEREDERITATAVEDADSALSYLDDHSVDCIVSDHDMPGMNGLELLETVRETYPDLPFVLFTGKGSEEIASEAISAGVSDYLQKGTGTEQYELLANRIGNAVEQHRASRAVERAEGRLRELAENTNDALWMYSGDWSELQFINSAYEDIWGQSAEHLRENPRAFLDAVHPDDREFVREAVERLSAGESVDIEFRVNERESYGRWAWVQAEPIVESGAERRSAGNRSGADDGDVVRIVGFTRDITVRKRRERMLEALHDATRRLIEVDSERAVAELAVETARDVFGAAPARCWLDGEDGLVPAAATDADAATLPADDPEPVRAVYETGESRVRVGTETVVDDTEIERELLLPVEDGGVLLLGAADADAFDDIERSLAQVLTSNVASALGRVRREVELREQQAFTEAALDALDETFYVFDTDGTLLRWNDELSAATGYDDAKLAEMGPAEFFADEHRERVEAAIVEIFETGGTRVEADVERRDGERVPFELTGAVLTDGDGDPVGFVGTGRDISRRKERERELERYRRIVETMGDGVYELDETGTYLHVNDYLAELSGYDRGTWQEREPAEFFAPEDIEAFEDAIRNLLSADDTTVESVEADLRTADGESVPIEVTLTLRPMEDGEFRGTVGVVRDITERRERERELEQYETIVETIPDEVYALDADGRFTTVIPPTDSELTTTGYEPAELVGEHVSVIMDEDDIATGEQKIQELLEDEERRKASFEMETITRDGEHIPNENHIALRPLDDGEFRGTVGVLRDITERKERERELQRQNERLERFVGVVSHDLRNPLNVAQNRLELAERECGSDHLDEIAESHERMGSLIDDLLTLARTGERATDVGPVDLDAVAETCRDAVGSDSATLDVETDRTVVADEERLRRLLENLYRNAVEHGGPDVTVTVGDTPDGFYVADDGPGIPEAERDDVFESGYTKSECGTGFGLSIVEEIATAHGWSVSVTESKSGVTASDASGGSEDERSESSGGARFEITGVEFA